MSTAARIEPTALTAQDVMQSSVVSLTPDAPLASIQQLFFDEQIHGAPVIDDVGQVVGIVTSMDLVRSATERRDDEEPGLAVGDYLSELLDLDAGEGQRVVARVGAAFGDRVASDVMTHEPVGVAPDASIGEVARCLTRFGIHRVLVIDDDGTMLGIISSADLVTALATPG